MKDSIIKRVKVGGNSLELINLLREELHHLILQEMDRHGVFQDICFLGGTALRILYGLDRYSEDLDFSTSAAINRPFDLKSVAEKIERNLLAFGICVGIRKIRVLKNVHSCFFAFEEFLYLLDKRSFRKDQKLAVKIDVDTNPPAGAVETITPVTGPLLYKVRNYDLPSLFAGKIGALLYRQYTKGRDLYDFLWYVGRGTSINRCLLEASASQAENKKIEFTEESLKSALTARFKNTDFTAAKSDVAPFLSDSRAVSLFDRELFIASAEKVRFS